MSTWNDVGGNPAPGNPAEIRTVANYMGELSVTARLARRQLAALQRGELQACWTGIAADAFASELERLPADLGKLERSLDHASTSVHRWATTVDNAQQQAERSLRDHGQAEYRLRVAEYERDRERDAALRDAANDPIGAVGDVLSGNNRLAPYDRAVDDAYDQVRRVRNQIEQVRDEVDAAARTIARMLEEASRLGIPNDAWYEKIGEFLEGLREALVQFLRVLDEFLDTIGPFLGFALIIAGILTGNPAFALAGLALATADLGVTVARAALGDETVTWAHILDDTIDVGLAALGVAAAYASGASALGTAFDVSIDVIAGAKAGGDIAGLFAPEGQPGSVFELVYDLAGGEGSVLDTPVVDTIDSIFGPDPDPSPSPGPDPSPMPGPDPAPQPGPDPSPMPGPDPAPQPGPDPSPMPGPDPAPQPGPDPSPGPMPQPDPAPVGGGGLPGGDAGGSAGGGGLPSSDFGGGPTEFDPLGDDLGGVPADLSVDYQPLASSDASSFESATGLVPDAAPAAAFGASAGSGLPVADVASAGAGDDSGIGLSKGLVGGVAAVAGLAGAAAGAKRIVDDHRENDDDTDGNTDVWKPSLAEPDVGRPVAVVDPIDPAPTAETSGAQPSDPESDESVPFDPEVTMDPALTTDPSDLVGESLEPFDRIDERLDHGETIALAADGAPGPEVADDRSSTDEQVSEVADNV